jgi:plastocyanin
MFVRRLGSSVALLASLALLLGVELGANTAPAGEPWAHFPGQPGLPGNGKHLVFLTGDEEYRSEESMPQLAQILAARHGFDCTVLFSVNRQTGVIDPKQRDHLPGLEALARADLMIVFTRFRVLPDAQMKHIAAYLESGRPVIGVRTATHAFGSFSAATHPPDASTTYARYEWNFSGPDFPGGFGQQVLGATHRNHWGLHGKQSTRGVFAPGAAAHPLLRGIRDGEIWGPTDVYEVLLPLPAGCTPVLLGQVLQGMAPDSPPVVGEQLNPKWKRLIKPNDPMLPIVWTTTRPVGQRGRVVSFTNGGAMAGTSDFASEGLRRLFVNACYWTVGLEAKLPAQADVTPPSTGNPFRAGLTPQDASRLAAPEFALRTGDTVLFHGNSMVERLLESGHLEAHLQLAHPEKKLRVRSLAWTGDEVGHRLRPEGYVEHLKSLLTAWPANVVVLGYGMNESFAGPAGLADFRAHYTTYLREIARLHPGAKLVLLSPLAVEERTAPAGAARNADVAAYAAAIAELARAHGAQFVDLFAASRAAYARSASPLTTHGIHLNADGAREIGTVIARALSGPAGGAAVEPPRLEDVARAAAEKHRHVAELVRPKNAALYYGVRKRPEEYAAEIPRYHELLRQAEHVVHALAAQPRARFADFPSPSLPPLPEGKVTPYRFPGGTIKAPGDLQQDFVVAEGYAVNLFASEEQFPELRNPVQLSFDARGRLWIVTMPSFPHTIPGETPRDKILILEDTDRDGRADKSTVFADGFDALDGIAFHERGVIVSAQPRLLILNDTDGDGRADTRTELLRGVDVTDSHHGGMVASDPIGHVIFADGVFHRSQFETPFGVVRGIDSTTYRLDPATGRLKPEWQSMTPNPWKVSFDRHGNLLQRYGGGHVLDALPLTWTPLGVYHPYGHGTVLNYAKGSALSVISSPNFPAEFQQGVASAALLGSYVVSLSPVSADTGPLVATRRLDVLSTKNSTFRPVDVEFGLDGALYVSDFSSLIIGHAQHAMRDPQWNHVRGRIWRVVHTGKPVARDWPKIDDATEAELLALLTHPQNLVRHHARIALRRLGAKAVPALDAWVAAHGRGQRDFDQARLEAAWVLTAAGEVRPAWIADLLQSADPLVRAAAVQLVRFHAGRLPTGPALLALASADPHPRVRMAVVNTVAHLRPTHSEYSGVLPRLVSTDPAVQQMVTDLQAGTETRKSRSVPVLEVAPATRVAHWLSLGQTGQGDLPPYATPDQKRKAKSAPPVTRSYRTFVDVTTPQTAVLSVKHGYLDVSANGVQVLTADSPFSSEQQVTFELRPGLNPIEISFRRLRGDPPPVFVFDALGQPLAGTRFAPSAAALQGLATTWDKQQAADAGALRVQAVPNQMQFAPTELRVKAGSSVRLVFTNPDLMPHNFVLVAPGAAEAVGGLADAMASQPTAMARHFIPETLQVLHATPLVEPNGRAELAFTAPATPGSYPYLCTFPGHWRVMRGVMIVE